MKKLFLSFAPTILWLEIVLFCCIFASCESKEIDEKNKDKVNKSADSLKISTRKIDTSKKIINNENLAEKSDEKSTEKPAKKLDSTAIKVKLTKKWEITGNYWVSSLETFNNNENYFLDLQKNGSYTLKAHLEDVSINETGKWQLQNPKMKFRKFDETDPKDAGVPIEDNEEILILIPKNSNNNKERLFLFNLEEKAFTFNLLTRPSGFFVK